MERVIDEDIKEISEEEFIRIQINKILMIMRREKNREISQNYYRMYNNLMNRLLEIEAFKTRICDDEYVQGSEVEELFNKFNSYAFAGFDYYYTSDVKSKAESKNPVWSTFYALINENQLDKLREVIKCDGDLDFISYNDKDGYVRRAVLLKNGCANINLIPFTRDIDNCITMRNGDGSTVTFTREETEKLFKSDILEHNNMGYNQLRMPLVLARHK